MTNDKIVGIYCIENLINGKRYIGQSVNIKARWIEHKKMLKRNRHHNQHLLNAWNIYGEENFKFYILKRCSEDELDYLECMYIEKYDTWKKEFGYNKDRGGRFQRIFTDEHRKRISEARIKLFKNPDFRDKYKQDAEPILQIDLDGNVIKTWYCNPVDIAKEDNSFLMDKIYRCLKGEFKTHSNYVWIYLKDYDESTFNIDDFKSYNNKKKIYQYDTNGNLVKIWDSGYQAELSGFSQKSIRRVCNREKKKLIYKNYFWSWVEMSSEEVVLKIA